MLVSLGAEPLTGLADTAFVSILGSASVAALGVGTVVLSSALWTLSFLGIGTQTEVAHALGAGRSDRARELSGLALVLAAVFGLGLVAVGLPSAGKVAAAMGATAGVYADAVVYLRIRLLGAPAVLITIAAFGTLRGLLEMRTPLRIAVSINALNILLDAVLIFGMGPVPPLGVAGAAWASIASQWFGAIWAAAAVRNRLGLPRRLHGRDVRLLLTVGRDLFLRTGMLTGFVLLTTRAATRIGADAGAANQAIRQVWNFTALVLDAYGASAQSLVGYFLGAKDRDQARRVAFVACAWGFGTGLVLTLGMWLGRSAVAQLLVPASARDVFLLPWMVASTCQPLNALSFATDGIHWGASDYPYLRNAMVLATLVGGIGISLVDEGAPGALDLIWIVTGCWIVVRTVLGVGRIWFGIGSGPLAKKRDRV